MKIVIALVLLHYLVLSYSAAASHYDTLRIKSTATLDDVKQSYRTLAKKYHPDKNKNDPSANEKFIELTKAYEILSDESKRREYDFTLSTSNGGRRKQFNQDFNMHQNRAQHASYQNSHETYMFRTPDGRIFKFQSSGRHNVNPDDFFNQYFQNNHYEYHQQNYHQGFMPWFLETAHIFISLCLTMAIPLTVTCLILTMIYQGCSNFIKSILFKHQYSDVNSSYARNKHENTYTAKSSENQSKPTPSTPKQPLKSSKTPNQPFTPEEKAMERLRQRHLDESGIILIVALTISGWNILTQIKPYFNNEKKLKFLQHINGRKLENVDGSSSDILALTRRGSKWTPYYITSDISSSTPSEDGDIIHNKTFDISRTESETECDVHEDNSKKLKITRPLREEIEEWIVKILNGEVPGGLRNISTSPLPIVIDR